MSNTLMEGLQSRVRSITGTAYDFNGDLHAYADWWGIPMNPISGRLIPIVQKLQSGIDNSTSALNWLLQNYQTDIPGLGLNFVNSETLDPRITFSRASNATLVNSAGAVAYAPHNLLTFSESLDNSVWSKTNVTVTANTTVAPDGTTTADTLNFTDPSSFVYQTHSPAAASSGQTFVFSVWLASITKAKIAIRIAGSVTGTGGETLITLTPTLTRYSVTVVIPPGNTGVQIGLENRSFLGGDGLLGTIAVWGAQLNVGALQPYYCTTVENALGFTQEFNNAAWTKTNSTITANATTAPDGSVTADTLVEDAAAAFHQTSQSYSASASSVLTLSIYAKASERPRIRIAGLFSANWSSLPQGVFDLSTGQVVSSTGFQPATITPVGDGWYRCAVYGQTVSTGTTTVGAAFGPVPAGGTTNNYTGDGTSGIFIWGAQLSDSASLDPYVYNPAAAFTSTAYYGPRFDYDPVTLAPRGLLIEEQRTNSIRNNTMVGAVAGTPGTLPTNWSFTGGGLAANVIGIGSESGISYIDVQFVGTASSSSSGFRFEATNQTAAASGQAWTGSMYIRRVAGATANFSAIGVNIFGRTSANAANTDTGTTSILSELDATSIAVNRKLHTRTLSDATTAFVSVQILFGHTIGVAVDITLRIGLPQLELGAFATSVIPTTTAAATRAADVATMVGDNFSSWYNQTEGTLFLDGAVPYIVPSGNFPTYASFNDGTANNRIDVGYLTSGVSGLEVVSGGALQAGIYPAVGATARKIAGAYQVNNFAISVNGGTAATDTTGIIPVVDRMRIGDRSGVTLNGYIRRIAFYPRRLSNSELQAVTA